MSRWTRYDLCLSEWANQLKTTTAGGRNFFIHYMPEVCCFGQWPTLITLLQNTFQRGFCSAAILSAETTLKWCSREWRMNLSFSGKAQVLISTQLNTVKGRHRSGGRFNSRTTLVKLLQHLQLQVVELYRGRAQAIWQTHKITVSVYLQSFQCSSLETV